MEAPKCKICGERHWSQVCDKVIETITAPGSQVVFKRALVSVTADELMAEVRDRNQSALEEILKEKPKFDRNAYQREYMRKRRAKEKK